MKIKIVLYNFVIFIFLFLIFDFLFSNLYLNKLNTSCYHIEEDYYELKKNCKGREQFKPSFPTVDINTNEFGHRISDIKNSENDDEENLIETETIKSEEVKTELKDIKTSEEK